MIEREILARPIVRGALAVCGLCLLLAGWTFMDAIRVRDVAEAAPVPFDASGLLAQPQRHSSIDVAAAVANDVFSPDRAAPAEPYRLPGDEEPSVHVEPPEAAPPIVIGTAILGEGRNFAICELAGGKPETVRAGEKLGEFTVKTIERGRVVFSAPNGKLLDISASKTGS